METTRFCTVCAAERVFEQPPCVEGHDDCPEWICTDCGDALLGAAPAPRRDSSAA